MERLRRIAFPQLFSFNNFDERFLHFLADGRWMHGSWSCPKGPKTSFIS